MIMFLRGFLMYTEQIKHCVVCGSKFRKQKGITQKYCSDCKEKYTPHELLVLIGINQGKYNKKMANEIKELLDKGTPKTKIAKKYELDDPSLINPLIDFLYYKDIKPTTISQKYFNSNLINKNDLESSKQYNYSNKIAKEKEFNKYRPYKKKCLVCGQEFIEAKNSNGQKYCNTCKSKYKGTELLALAGIKKGKYNEQTAIKIYNLQKENYSNKEIGKKLNIPDNLITPIIDLLLPDNTSSNNISEPQEKLKKNNTAKNCPVCGNEFLQPKGTSQKYCPDCIEKYNNYQQLVLIGINQGKYNKKTANQIKELLDQNNTKVDIAKKLNLSNPSLINPIMEFLYYESQGPLNSKYINSDDLNSINQDNYFIKIDYEDKANILFKKIISKENRESLFNCLVGNGVIINNMKFTENKNELFEVIADLDVDINYIEEIDMELNMLFLE